MGALFGMDEAVLKIFDYKELKIVFELQLYNQLGQLLSFEILVWRSSFETGIKIKHFRVVIRDFDSNHKCHFNFRPLRLR